jgi:hypothetical protein
MPSSFQRFHKTLSDVVFNSSYKAAKELQKAFLKPHGNQYSLPQEAFICITQAAVVQPCVALMQVSKSHYTQQQENLGKSVKIFSLISRCNCLRCDVQWQVDRGSMQMVC